MQNRILKGLLPFEELMPSLAWDYPGIAPRKMFKVDVKETEKGYLIHADLAGYRKEDITVEYKEKYLVITAVREDSKEEVRENYILRERSSGQVQRSFYVENVDEEQVNVSFHDGVLTVDLPRKRLEEGESRKFDIR